MAGADKNLGAKLGPRLGNLMVQGATQAFRERMGLEHQLRVNSTRTIVDWMGLEFGQVMSPFADKVLKRSDIDPDVARVLKNMTSGANQWQALAGIAWGASGVTSMLGTIMNNYLAPLTYQTVSKDPLLVPEPSLLPQLLARGVINEGQYAYAMAGQGFDSVWQGALYNAALSWPDEGTLLQLVRLGLLSEQEMIDTLGKGGFTSEFAVKIAALKDLPLTAADAALAQLRGIMSQADAYAVGAKNGVSAADMDVLVQNTGEPPATEALLLLWRRGQISTAELEKGIRQSRVRDEWIPAIKQLGIEPPSPAAVIDSLVTGQTDEGTARRRWDEAGGDPSWFDTAWHTGGEAPTPNELAVLANRGIIPWKGTGSQVVSYEQGFKESRFKDKYLPYFRQLHVYLPPPRTVTALLNSGAIDKTEATKLLLEQGLDPALVAAYTDDAKRHKTAKQRQLQVAEIELLYQEQAITETEATGYLQALGYDAQDAAFVLQTADLTRLRKYTDAVLNALHSKYVNHKIDRSTASSDLDALGVAAKQRDALLALWDLEASATVRRLTEAQVISAFKKKIVSLPEAKQMLLEQGYPDRDADILLLIAGAPANGIPPVPAPGSPTA